MDERGAGVGGRHMSKDGTTGLVTELLDEARACFDARGWGEARRRFLTAQEHAPLVADDLYALSSCAWWLGDLSAALPAMQDAYHRYLEEGRPTSAALVAMDTGYTLAIRREAAQASGWIARAARLLGDQPPCPEHGYLRYLAFEDAFTAGDLDAASDAAEAVHDLGEDFDHPTLRALGVVGRGRVLVQRGEVAAGMALLDEAMVAAVSDELEPTWAGNVYCHLMATCSQLADLRRASEWTEVTARWCEQMPGAGPFLGICRVHRAEVLRVRGDWAEAEREVVHVCEELAHFDVEIVAEAHYELGELRRLRGDLDGAERAYRTAHELGRDPQPGLALVWLGRGRAEVAAASIRTALTTATGTSLSRASLLPAAVEIQLATDDVAAARAASEELARLAERFGSRGFEGAAALARGMVLLAEREPTEALAALRDALRTWHELGAPYETARTRLHLARAYEELEDRTAASLEQEAATTTLDQLGAALGDRSGPPPRSPADLSPREAEVLTLVATGRSNQQIADELVLSVRTIERHLATVYQKLGVHGRSARAAAVSHAHRTGLLPR